jgi:proteasome lid subunit RPN8/RPN11
MVIPRKIVEEMVAHAEEDTPIEACGFLMGTNGRVSKSVPVTNTDKREDHFTFDAEEQWAAYKVAEQEGLDILGVYHSHPSGPPHPSPEDVRLAFDPGLLSVIVSLAENEPTIRGFYVESRKGGTREEILLFDGDEGSDSPPARL